jgi:hypothetical protein
MVHHHEIGLFLFLSPYINGTFAAGTRLYSSPNQIWRAWGHHIIHKNDIEAALNISTHLVYNVQMWKNASRFTRNIESAYKWYYDEVCHFKVVFFDFVGVSVRRYNDTSPNGISPSNWLFTSHGIFDKDFFYNVVGACGLTQLLDHLSPYVAEQYPPPKRYVCVQENVRVFPFILAHGKVHYVFGNASHFANLSIPSISCDDMFKFRRGPDIMHDHDHHHLHAQLLV